MNAYDEPLFILLVSQGTSFAFLEEFVSNSAMDVEETDVEGLSGYKFFDAGELFTAILYLNANQVLFSIRRLTATSDVYEREEWENRSSIDHGDSPEKKNGPRQDHTPPQKRV